MKTKGKIIGGALGLLIGGPIGLVFGFIIGHLFDVGYFQQFAYIMKTATEHTHAQQIFFNNTFKIMGYLAKSDGHVSKQEIQTARLIMNQLGLNEMLKRQAIRLFTVGKQPEFDLDAALSELRTACAMQPTLLQLFLEIQYHMASADGQLSTAKQATLQNICLKLGMTDFRFYQRRPHEYGQQPSKDDLQDAYEMLGVSKNATPDEIKTAYRRLMSQNHPDKLIAKGLPPEMIKIATQKTQRIKQAYEYIKQAQGI